MAILTIERTSEWANKLRKIGIYLNGEKLDVIANGETKSFDVPVGTHTLYCKIDYITSRKVTFEITEERGTGFRLSSFAYGSWWKIFLASWYASFGHKDYIKLEEEFI